MTFHPEVLPGAQAELLKRLGPMANAEGFYLAGGTALAIQLGHRQSVDFDWFRAESFDPLVLRTRFEGLPIDVSQTAADTLHGSVAGVAVTFLGYRYPLLQPAIVWPEFGIRLASFEDLACMKLAAIAQRGARKDFVDLYAIGATGRTLAAMLQLFQQKYSIRDVGHVLVALSYFDDAEREPMPLLRAPLEWESVKSTIRGWIKALAG